MRILYVGAVEFSRHCLEQVLSQGGNVVGVLTLPKSHADFHSDYADLSVVARKHGVPSYELTSNINEPHNIRLIRSLEPDVILVFGWSQLISRKILAIPSVGCIGSHPSLLPINRGRHPLIWALVDGLEESGLTFFYMDEGADTGDILWQKKFSITLDDDARSLYDKIEELATEAIGEFLPQLEKGVAPRTPQDHEEATYRRKRGEEDGQIDWSAPTLECYNLIRALTRPYVGAHTYYDGEKILIWQAALPEDPLSEEAKRLEPGTVLRMKGSDLCVRTGDGVLVVKEYEAKEDLQIVSGKRLGPAS